MDVDHFVFDVGDRVTGSGELRPSGGEMWFDPLGVLPSVGAAWSPPVLNYVVRLEHADLSVTTGVPRRDGSVAPLATVTGVWSGTAIQVEEQSPAVRGRRPRPVHTQPPCPPPAGGWPIRRPIDLGENLAFDIGDLEDTGAAVCVVYFRPGPDQTVLVVAAEDEAEVERQLRPQLDGRLCVVPSRWTKSQIGGVTSVLLAHMPEWTISHFGEGADVDGQAVVRSRMLRVLPEMARWATDVPDGLLEVEPGLAPARP